MGLIRVFTPRCSDANANISTEWTELHHHRHQGVGPASEQLCVDDLPGLQRPPRTALLNMDASGLIKE